MQFSPEQSHPCQNEDNYWNYPSVQECSDNFVTLSLLLHLSRDFLTLLESDIFRNSNTQSVGSLSMFVTSSCVSRPTF